MQERLQQVVAARREAEHQLAEEKRRRSSSPEASLNHSSSSTSRRKQAADARLERALAALSQLQVSRAQTLPQSLSPIDATRLSSALQRMQDDVDSSACLLFSIRATV